MTCPTSYWEIYSFKMKKSAWLPAPAPTKILDVWQLEKNPKSMIIHYPPSSSPSTQYTHTHTHTRLQSLKEEHLKCFATIFNPVTYNEHKIPLNSRRF